MFRRILFFVIFYLFSNTIYGLCPEKCNCKKINENGNNLKVRCGGTPQNKISSIKELDFGDDIENVIHLDLSKNQISFIESIEFTNYTNLKRLDLSFNSLKLIDESMFGSILSLERLKLSTNVIVHILQGSFEKLKSLKQLDISGNPLACDCDLLWLVSWSNNMSLKLQPTPKCETPSPFKGFLLKKLRVGSDLHCESPLQPLLELKPDKNQLIFEGDEIVLRCRAPRVAVGAPRDSEDLPARAHVFWGWSDKIIEPNSTEDIIYRDPSIYFPSIQIDAKHLSDSGLLDSILKIPYATPNHTGMWDCRLRSQQANLSRTISVIVISEKTTYCPASNIRNNKGSYFWPRTIRGKIVKLLCAGEAPSYAYATYKCNEHGDWVELNTDMCPFISETTRILEQFAKVNLSIARGSVLESAKRLRNYTQSEINLRKFRDPIDLVFISKTLMNYLNFVSQEKDLGSMLLDIVSQVMILPSYLIQYAQQIDNSAIKFVNSIEQAAQHTQLSLTHKNNLAIEYFKIRSDTFNGITCTWFRVDSKQEDKRTFQCNTATQIMEIFKHHIDASIQVPSGILQTQSSSPSTISDSSSFISPKLMIAVYQNSNFFPQNKNQTNFRVTSAVIGVKLISDSYTNDENLTDPILIMLRVQPFHNEISAPVPVWWDPNLNSWIINVCQFSYFFHGLLVFSCNRLGYYGLLQNKKYLNDFPDENAGAYFRLSPIGFYIGGIVLFICTWINIITYLSYGNLIQMARRQRHSLINTWLALAFLSFIFTIGIYQTEDYRICQVIGILIHYFSLCIILWVCVTLSNMYKRLSKRNRLPMDEIPKENVGRKPILGLYLVGWGIGLIICGISGAVNVREYAAYSYCFLRTGPALSAIFVPSTILLLFLCILFICIRCHIQTIDDHNGHLSEGTQATENVDLELLESNGNHVNPSDRYRSMTLSSPTSSMQDDLEHTNGSQLRAHFIFIFLYLITWLSAAASIITPFDDQILYEEEIFSIIYAITSSLLGIFILFYYCISRNDVRIQWSALSCKNVCQHNCCRSRSISDTKELNTVVTYHQACGTLNSGSRSTSQCSKTRPSSATNHLKTHCELNSATLTRTDSPNKILTAPSNIVLVNRKQFVHNSVILGHDLPNPEIFYNPNQINVARKFFKKQKRLAKRNNFEFQRQIERGDFGDGASDASSSIGCSFPKTRGMSIFSSGSKVNNTNIHVKGLLSDIGSMRGVGHYSKDTRQPNTNPNILSDSCNESDLIVDAERLVLGGEGIRVLSTRNKINNNEMIANIYTNVPETSEPQHEIVTMRADDKFRKSCNVDELLEQDEIDLEQGNDLNSQSDRTSTPHYVNGNIRNIMEEHNQPSTSSLPFQSNNDQLMLSLNSPIIAMNTIGLPSKNNSTTSSSTDMIDLDKNDAYISESLEISDRVYHQNDNELPILIKFQQKKSKSLNNINKLNRMNEMNEFDEQQIRSISLNNLLHINDNILGPIPITLPIKNLQEKRLLSSPILFSPSLCEIDDLPSPQDRRKPINNLLNNIIINESNLLYMNNNDNSIINNDNDQSLNMFNQSLNCNFSSSSPTCESDLNYQNSELSIRSHGVYAPQPDNDLNITLTGTDYFPYQSSEINDDQDSDNDDNDDDDNDYDSNDQVRKFLISQRAAEILPEDIVDNLNDSQTSIDELYERITRRPNLINHQRLQHRQQFENVHNSGSIITNVAGESGINHDIKQNDENDDDSSQCSILSYIDPNESAKI